MLTVTLWNYPLSRGPSGSLKRQQCWDVLVKAATLPLSHRVCVVFFVFFFAAVVYFMFLKKSGIHM